MAHHSRPPRPPPPLRPGPQGLAAAGRPHAPRAPTGTASNSRCPWTGPLGRCHGRDYHAVISGAGECLSAVHEQLTHPGAVRALPDQTDEGQRLQPVGAAIAARACWSAAFPAAGGMPAGVLPDDPPAASPPVICSGSARECSGTLRPDCRPSAAAWPPACRIMPRHAGTRSAILPTHEA